MHVRTLYTKTPPQTAPLDLNELVEDVLGLVRRDINRAGIALHADLQPDLPQVVGDRVQLQQVLLNLLRNAVEAMSHDQGTLRIVAVKTTSSGADSVEVSVIDSGQGFKTGDEERIFDPFYTTKADGMGLGLAMCRMIVRAHGGQLWATPNKGSGSTFRFVLSSADRDGQSRLTPAVAQYLGDRRRDDGATLGGSQAVPGR
jgi:signal transduction histidine kinase